MPDMSRFRSKNTKLELFLRRHLFARGYRYRLHDPKLKGHPDMVFPKYHAVVFVHGCFWHAHKGCAGFHLPKTNRRFWVSKFRKNQERDRRTREWLDERGWRVLVVWECALGRKAAFPLDDLLDFISCWLEGGGHSCEVSGRSILPMLELDIISHKIKKIETGRE